MASELYVDKINREDGEPLKVDVGLDVTGSVLSARACYVKPTSDVNISSGAVIPIEEQVLVGDDYAVSTADDYVEVLTAGWYLLHYHMTTEISNSSSDRTACFAQLDISTDGGGSWDKINGTFGGMYNRTNAYDLSNASVLHIENLSARDRIRLYATRNSGSAELEARSDATAMLLIRM